MKRTPPEISIRLLRWFCPDSLLEGIEGDLLEKFEVDLSQHGPSVARRRFTWNVILFFRSGILTRNKFSTTFFNTTMIQNYLIVAFRNILRNKTFSAINVFGLGIGLAACVLIFQFVDFETGYDSFNEKLDRTYRITNDRFQNGKLIQHGTIMYPTVGPTMAKDYPEIEENTRIMPAGRINVKVDDKIFRDDRALFTDEKFLSIFSYPVLAGEKLIALKDKYSIVLSEETARKYYKIAGNDFTPAIGKLIYWGFDKQPYKVTAVLKSLPQNSHLHFDVLVSYSTLISPEDHGADDSWTWSDMRHYLVLRKGADYKALESKFPAFSEHYFQGDKVSGSVEKFYLQPLKRAHLYSDYEYDIARIASGKAVWAMLIVSFFILFIAWINYINLTTSKALERAKEVGLRKVMGAYRIQLIRQFIFESIVISTFALVVAIVVVILCQGIFNQMVGANLSLWKFVAGLSSNFLIGFIAMLTVGIFLSGFYPAFVLSSYQPVAVLRGKFQHSTGGQLLRKSLVVFQFTTSVVLITGSLIVARQLTFMNSVDLGINLQNTLVVEAPERTQWDSTFISRVEAYKHELLQLPDVLQASTSGSLPGDRLGRSFDMKLADQTSSTHYTMSRMGADYNFFDTYNIKIIAGRKFIATDHNADFNKINSVIINKNAVNLLGLASAEEAIGKELKSGDRAWRIIGVVGDFHQESLKSPMEPIVFMPTYSTYGPTSIKIAKDNIPATISKVESVYQKYFPGNAFEYFFIEDQYNHQYDDDNRFGKVISVFTLLALIISSLGLIALSSYTAIQRTKEIGVRKVMGASLFNIVTMLSSDFIKLIILASFLAMPVAWYAMDRWLQSYAYRIQLNVLLFLIPVIAILFIAILTMSFQIIKTARLNPAKTLKYE